MCKRFDEWALEIEKYCLQNNLSFDKAKKMSMGSNKEMLYLAYYDPEKGKKGLLDETPMPLALWIKKENDKLVFEQTQYTKKYLAN